MDRYAVVDIGEAGVVIGLSTNRCGVIGAFRIGHARGDSHSEILNDCLKENFEAVQTDFIILDIYICCFN